MLCSRPPVLSSSPLPPRPSTLCPTQGAAAVLHALYRPDSEVLHALCPLPGPLPLPCFLSVLCPLCRPTAVGHSQPVCAVTHMVTVGLAERAT